MSSLLIKCVACLLICPRPRRSWLHYIPITGASVTVVLRCKEGEQERLQHMETALKKRAERVTHRRKEHEKDVSLINYAFTLYESSASSWQTLQQYNFKQLFLALSGQARSCQKWLPYTPTGNKANSCFLPSQTLSNPPPRSSSVSPLTLEIFLTLPLPVPGDEMEWVPFRELRPPHNTITITPLHPPHPPTRTVTVTPTHPHRLVCTISSGQSVPVFSGNKLDRGEGGGEWGWASIRTQRRQQRGSLRRSKKPRQGESLRRHSA